MGKERWTEGKEMGERARLGYLSRGLGVRSYATGRTVSAWWWIPGATLRHVAFTVHPHVVLVTLHSPASDIHTSLQIRPR